MLPSPTRHILNRMSLLTSHFPAGGRSSSRLKRPLSSTTDPTSSTSSTHVVSTSLPSPPPAKKKRATTKRDKASVEPAPSADKVAIPAFAVEPPLPGPTTTSVSSTAATVLPGQLTWDIDHARQHLIQHDPRFEDMFAKWNPEVYTDPKDVDAFRMLAHSILGQQISWKAARSITHRFVHLFFPSDMPEKHDPTLPSPTPWAKLFPSPAQILALPEPTRTESLRSAGLSGRKAEYVIALAEKFDSGDLSSQILLESNDDELKERLIALKGVGPWTVNMFSMFSVKRPDILPHGDLGVQKGLLLHTLSHPVPHATHATLRARLKTKAKGNVYLLPAEMDELTEGWKPYRTLGTWYMWKVCGSEEEGGTVVPKE